MTNQPPIRVTLAGRAAYEPEFVEDPPEELRQGVALPSGCIRRLSTPGMTCDPSCPGVQRDGGCCADLIRGREAWTFTIDRDGFWVLDG